MASEIEKLHDAASQADLKKVKSLLKKDIGSMGKKAFRKWLKDRYTILPAKNPLKICTAAAKKHPDLHEWLETGLK